MIKKINKHLWGFSGEFSYAGTQAAVFFSKSKKFWVVNGQIKTYKYQQLIRFYFKFGWSLGLFGWSPGWSGIRPWVLPGEISYAGTQAAPYF